MPAFTRYIQSHEARENANALNCFHGLLRFKADHDPAHLAALAEELVSACRYIISNYDTFDAKPEIYRDLRTRYELLLPYLKRLQPR